MNEQNNEPKSEWDSPVLVVYGTVEELTLQAKLKKPGFKDDFGVAGISAGA